MRVEPVRAGARRERREIDMRGEVGLAGAVQHVHMVMRLDRLQRVADAGSQMAVVDEQAGAAMAGDPRGDRLHQRGPCRRDLDDRAVGCRGGIGRQQGRIGRADACHEMQPPAVVEPDRALQPSASDLDELADRDRVEQLVGDDDQRLLGQLGNASGAR